MVIDFSSTPANPFPVLVGDGSPYMVGRIVFQVKGTGTFSLVPKVRARGSKGNLVAADLTAVHYTNRVSGTDVTAGTAITTAGLYDVDASGVAVWIDGSYTSGSCLVVTEALEG